MLVLSRRLGQKIICGDVTITFTKVHGDTIKLGFEGPKEVRILRQELAKREAKRGTDPHDDPR